jgi:hypothetical protein
MSRNDIGSGPARHRQSIKALEYGVLLTIGQTMSARPTGDTDKRQRPFRRLQLGGDTGVGLELLPKFDREKRANAGRGSSLDRFSLALPMQTRPTKVTGEDES